MVNTEYLEKNSANIEISIIRINHEIKAIKKNFPENYKNNQDYIKFEKKLMEKLELLKKVDYKSYLKYYLDIDENTRKIFNNTNTYNNLGLKEKELIKKHNYDYKKDPLKLFTDSPTPSTITTEWQVLLTIKNSMSPKQFYDNRDWNS
ncbi:hypothetical protein AFAEC_0559 [Aliarcobacter faecis]|uniref:hypothetical protein n=1 Tax=Aliarcobacter faecis TaxID=1564138 RepID=UPI00047BACCB|nr:hypothetical protein [Aliarcobacter faecis]QKF72750.1 hypothetical protein AFAEC_0559 [Aliarcobacter faecis]